MVIAQRNDLKTSTSTSLDEKGVCQSSTPWHTPKTKAPMVELADTSVLGTDASRRESSSLSWGTKKEFRI